MLKHEHHLLIGITSFLLTGATWLMIGAFITGISPFMLLKSFFFSLSLSWIGVLVFVLIGLKGFHYEMTIISKALHFIESEEEHWVNDNNDDRYIFGLGFGLFIGIVLLGFVFGTDEIGILEGMYNVLFGSLGFLIILGLMLLGAVVARIRRERG